MFDFKKTAKEVLSTSQLKVGRIHLITDDFIRNYPDGFTLIQFDIIESDKNPYTVFLIKEHGGIYGHGGLLLTNICKEWVDAFDGDVEKANQELMESGGVRMKMKYSDKLTKNGYKLVEIIIL